jgi:hypothetical protein
MNEERPDGIVPLAEAVEPIPKTEQHAEEKPPAMEAPYAAITRTVAPLLAWLFPGAGHLFLRCWGKALIFFFLVALALGTGFAFDGKLYTPQQGNLFALFGSYACLGVGPSYFLLRAFPFSHGDPYSPWAEYGNRFVLTAGVMNLLLMLDAFDIAVGRKNKSL